jgi:putative peptidoglycan lipid II flippase
VTVPRDRRPTDERIAERQPPEGGGDPPDDDPPAEPRQGRGPRRRVGPDPQRDYGEANRRHARQFASGRVRRPPAASEPSPVPGWYEPEAATIEFPVVDDVFGLTAESPGVANQPPAPWLTGEHARVDVEPEPDPTGPGVAPSAPVGPGAPGAAPTADAVPEAEREALPSSQRSSMLVAAGIFLSRCSGLVRESVIANYLGTSPASDAFRAALRIPNLLQNLLGEGVLSASFIPVYARLRAEGREQEAGHVAGAVAGLLVALTGVLSLVGVVLAEPLTRVLVPGFHDSKFDLTVQLVRIIFPGIGFLVLSAWCLGVLNSHRKFFLSYVAPVVWNAAQIAALVAVGLTTTDTRTLAYAVSWGVLIGGILQFGIQIGPVRRLLGGVRLSLDTANASVRSVLARFAPVVMGRGVVQIMGYVDLLLASYLATGAVASLQYALVLYLLPIGLFGMSVAAAELPELSEVEVHDPETRRRFRLRLEEGMARIAWYVAPTATLFIVVGDVIVRAVFQRGNFTSADTIVVWLTLAVFSMSLLATTSSRLLQNGLYALDDARTPARVAAMSVILAAIIGLAFMFPLDRLVVGPDGIEGWSDIFTFGPLPEAVRDNAADVAHLGIVGLAIGAAVSRWVEYRFLSRALAWRIGRTRLAGRWLNPIAAGCAAAALVAVVCEALFGELPSLVALVLVVGPAGLVYVAVTRRLGVPEATIMLRRVASLTGRVSR